MIHVRHHYLQGQSTEAIGTDAQTIHSEGSGETNTHNNIDVPQSITEDVIGSSHSIPIRQNTGM
jgi:hypothetical protein